MELSGLPLHAAATGLAPPGTTRGVCAPPEEFKRTKVIRDMNPEILKRSEYQPVKAYCNAVSDVLTANFGEPELGVIVPVSETTNIWFARAGLENFLAEVDAGRGRAAELPRLLQVHIHSIHRYEEWPHLEKLIGTATVARLRQLYAEAMAKPVVDISGIDDDGFEAAFSQARCEAEFVAPSLNLTQVADIIVTAHDLHQERVRSRGN